MYCAQSVLVLLKVCSKAVTQIFKFINDLLLREESTVLRSIHQYSQELQFVICKANPSLSLFTVRHCYPRIKKNIFFLGGILNLENRKIIHNQYNIQVYLLAPWLSLILYIFPTNERIRLKWFYEVEVILLKEQDLKHGKPIPYIWDTCQLTWGPTKLQNQPGPSWSRTKHRLEPIHSSLEQTNIQ